MDEHTPISLNRNGHRSGPKGGRPKAIDREFDPVNPDSLSDEYLEALLRTQVPDWSEKTLALFENLSVLERTFVEWLSTGRSASEAYRLAARREGYFDKSTGVISSQMKSKPTVKAALESALSDRNFGARYDREFKLQSLGSLVMRYQDSPSPKDWEKIPPILELMAKLQGEIVRKQEIQHSGTVGTTRNEVGSFIQKIIAEAIAPPPPKDPLAITDTVILQPEEIEIDNG